MAVDRLSAYSDGCVKVLGAWRNAITRAPDPKKRAHQGGVHAIGLVVHRRGGAGETVDLVEAGQAGAKPLGDIVIDEDEAVDVDQVIDVVGPARREIVQADNEMTAIDQGLAEMRSNKPGTTGDGDYLLRLFRLKFA